MDRASTEWRRCDSGACTGQRRLTFLTDTVSGAPVPPDRVARGCTVCQRVLDYEPRPADWPRV